jgi:deoxyribonuclease V
VAKAAFAEGTAMPVLRGQSRRPLFVGAAGMDPVTAAALVRSMHGPDRLPTLLRRVDQLARGHASPAAPPPQGEPRRG